MSVVFNMNAVSVLPTRVQADGSQLTHALAAADTDAFILDGDYPGFVGGHPSDGWFHAVIRDTTRKEIVKVNVAGSSRAEGLQVDRGQQGTQAVNWQPGAAIYQDITAADLQNMLQKEVFRTIDYIPDGVLVPDYRGEKVYQSDLQLWWKAVDGVNTYWRLIAGTIGTAAPTFSNPAGSYPPGAVVELSTTTPGATIYYTTDGSTPTDASTEYAGEITLGTFTIRAIAYGPERYYTPSSVSSAAYLIYLYETATPVLSRAAGAYASGTTVSITCATAGSTIYYTTDGSDPTDADTEYSGPIAITSGFTLKAIAYGLDGFYEPSEIASAAYTVSSGLLSLLDRIEIGNDSSGNAPITVLAFNGSKCFALSAHNSNEVILRAFTVDDGLFVASGSLTLNDAYQSRSGTPRYSIACTSNYIAITYRGDASQITRVYTHSGSSFSHVGSDTKADSTSIARVVFVSSSKIALLNGNLSIYSIDSPLSLDYDYAIVGDDIVFDGTVLHVIYGSNLYAFTVGEYDLSPIVSQSITNLLGGSGIAYDGSVFLGITNSQYCAFSFNGSAYAYTDTMDSLSGEYLGVVSAAQSGFIVTSGPDYGPDPAIPELSDWSVLLLYSGGVLSFAENHLYENTYDADAETGGFFYFNTNAGEAAMDLPYVAIVERYIGYDFENYSSHLSLYSYIG